MLNFVADVAGHRKPAGGAASTQEKKGVEAVRLQTVVTGYFFFCSHGFELAKQYELVISLLVSESDFV